MERITDVNSVIIRPIFPFRKATYYRCQYQWMTRTKLLKVSCPYCGKKTDHFTEIL